MEAPRLDQIPSPSLPPTRKEVTWLLADDSLAAWSGTEFWADDGQPFEFLAKNPKAFRTHRTTSDGGVWAQGKPREQDKRLEEAVRRLMA
jgi:hypothetical protein